MAPTPLAKTLPATPLVFIMRIFTNRAPFGNAGIKFAGRFIVQKKRAAFGSGCRCAGLNDISQHLVESVLRGDIPRHFQQEAEVMDLLLLVRPLGRF